MRRPIRERKGEAGQAILIVVLATSIFMLAALGLVVDGSHLYAQRTMAQAAADAGAQAGMMSIFDGTSGAWGSHTAGKSFTCSSNDTAAACKYAQSMDGFNLASDTVTVTPNPGWTPPNVSPTSTDPYNVLEVTVQRNVNTTLMGLFGTSASTIKAVGIAAIVQVVSPIPIIVTHPTLGGALNMNGNTSITITGGPSQSIQINSDGSGGTAFAGPSSGSVDLSKAGPNGTGANFGTFGGPTTNPGDIKLGTTGQYVAPSSPILDPLSGINPPSQPATNGSVAPCTKATCSSCPSGFPNCDEYKPGYYASGISVNNDKNGAMFDPGIYYIGSGGFTTKNSTVGMCTSCPADPTTVNGMLVYDTGPASKGCDASGGFTIDTNSNDVFYGAGVSATNLTAAPSAPYYGILFFEDRNACAQTHTLGQGNGCFSLVGTIYITNTLAIMKANPSQYQTVLYHGTPCSNTVNYGEIIVSQLTIKGTSGLDMGLIPQGFLKVRQVALVD